MAEVIVIDLPPIHWQPRPTRRPPTPQPSTDTDLLPVLALLLALAFALFAIPASTGATLATASALALAPTMLAASFAAGALILEVMTWLRNY